MSGPIYNATVRRSQGSQVSQGSTAVGSPTTSTFSEQKSQAHLTKADLRTSTKARKAFAIISSVLFFISLVFLILIQIGNLSNMHVLGDLYMFKIDTTNIKLIDGPKSSNQVRLTAQQSGMYDFYQVGLWNFCEGFKGKGIQRCSKPTLMYWFNPVQIILDELMKGEEVDLPAQVVNYLNIIRTASRAMFAMFFASTFTSFLSIFLCPLAVYSRLIAIPIGLFALISALMTFCATSISTAMWTILTHQIKTYAADLNIIPSIGMKMLIFMFIASGCALIAALIQVGLMCCCTSRRDIKTGRRVGRKARNEGSVPVEENPALRRRWWGSVSQ